MRTIIKLAVVFLVTGLDIFVGINLIISTGENKYEGIVKAGAFCLMMVISWSIVEAIIEAL